MAAWWPFGRRQRDAPATTADPRPRKGHAGPSVVEPTAVSNAWRDLPPLRPSAPPIELTAPVQRLADTMTSKHHTGVTGDEMGHIRAVDGPTGTVVGLLKPRVAMHRERTAAGSLIYAAAAPEPITAAAAVPLRGAQRQAIAPTERLVPPPVEAAAPVELIAPDRSSVPSPGVPPHVGSRPLAPAPPVPVAGAHQMPTTPTELPAVAARPVPAREYATPAVPPEAPPPLPVAVADAPVASAPAALSAVATDRVGGAAPHPAGAARRDHPHRAAHRRASAGASGEHGLDRRFTRRRRDAASARDPCRHRSPPGRCPRRAPAGAAPARCGPRPRRAPGCLDRCRVERSRDAA